MSAARMNASALQIPANASGRARCFGRFDGCEFFGQTCAVVVEEAVATAPVHDALGFPMCVGDLAIHISGNNPFGERSGPGFIRALGHFRVDWLGHEHRGVGLGFDNADEACIVTWDSKNGRDSHHTDDWQHIAFWASPDCYVSTAGVLSIAHDGLPFTAKYVVDGIRDQRKEQGKFWFGDEDKRHERAVRRLLEGLVGVSNQPTLQERPWFHLERSGRWAYKWEKGGVS